MEDLRDKIAEELKGWNETGEKDKLNYTPEELSTKRYYANRYEELKKIYLKFHSVRENRNTAALKNLKNKLDLLERKQFKYYIPMLWQKLKDAVKFIGYEQGIRTDLQKDYEQVRSYVNQTGLDHEYVPQLNIASREINIRKNQYYQMSSTDIMKCDYRLAKSPDGSYTTTYNLKVFATTDPSELKQVQLQFNSIRLLDNDQLYGLVSGQAVLHVEPNGQKSWLKLDSHDKDKDGNTPLIRVEGNSFDVREQIQKSQLQHILNDPAGATLINQLHNGKIAEVVDLSNGNRRVFQVQADPLSRRINITEERGNTVVRKMETYGTSLKVAHKKETVNRKAPAAKNSNTPSQGKRPKMKAIKGGGH